MISFFWGRWLGYWPRCIDICLWIANFFCSMATPNSLVVVRAEWVRNMGRTVGIINWTFISLSSLKTDKTQKRLSFHWATCNCGTQKKMQPTNNEWANVSQYNKIIQRNFRSLHVHVLESFCSRFAWQINIKMRQKLRRPGCRPIQNKNMKYVDMLNWAGYILFKKIIQHRSLVRVT